MGHWNLSFRIRESPWSFSLRQPSLPRWLKAIRDEWGFQNVIYSTRVTFHGRRDNNGVRFCAGKRLIFITLQPYFTNVQSVFFYWGPSFYPFHRLFIFFGFPYLSVSFLFIWSLRGSNFRTTAVRVFRSHRRLCDRGVWVGRNGVWPLIGCPIHFIDWWDRCFCEEIWEKCSCYNRNINMLVNRLSKI